ncbi:MAG TPA: TIGR03621 family F420-dependent LLM class oxidoreductase [Candidatus Dormibacteraeota bacterium]|nr:TIGR03621 family F420-dependent LLM class oxidoreductase [Candidatus Dormibacteraeota bacterium]
MRPFQFLAEASDVLDGRRLAETARRAEAIGYSGLVFTDHLLDQLAPIPAMATVAAATERLRVGTFVINNDLRHPAMLAQDLATIDVLSAGRLDIGIGAGWNEPEYRAIGVPFEPIGRRVARLTEAVAILKGAFAGEPFTFEGEHYRVEALEGRPLPAQRPRPPFLVGGGGRRILTLAAREADIVGLAPRILPSGRTDPRSLTLEAAEEKVAWVREAAGRRFDTLVINVYPSVSPVIVTDRPRAEAGRLADRLLARTGIAIAPEELLESPHIWMGSIDGLTEKVRTLRERLGVTSFMLGGVDELAPLVERLAGS